MPFVLEFISSVRTVGRLPYHQYGTVIWPSIIAAIYETIHTTVRPSTIHHPPSTIHHRSTLLPPSSAPSIFVKDSLKTNFRSHMHVEVIFISSEVNIKNIITVIHYIWSEVWSFSLSLSSAPSGRQPFGIPYLHWTCRRVPVALVFTQVRL